MELSRILYFREVGKDRQKNIDGRDYVEKSAYDELVAKFKELHDETLKLEKWGKELEEQLKNPAETEDIICSMSPIQVAEYLIGHETHIEEHTVFGIKYPADDVKTFEITDIEQIAEHLLVYCKHNKEER